MSYEELDPYKSPEIPREEIIIPTELREGIEKLRDKLTKAAASTRTRVDEYRKSGSARNYVNETDYLNVARVFDEAVELLGNILNKRDLCNDIQTLQNEANHENLKAYNDVLSFMKEHASQLEDIKVMDAKEKNMHRKSGCLPFASIIHRMLGGGNGGRE